MQFKTWKEARDYIKTLPGGSSEWTVDAEGENLGTLQAIITNNIVRRKTAAEKAQSERNLADLMRADLDSRTPIEGGNH